MSENMPDTNDNEKKKGGLSRKEQIERDIQEVKRLQNRIKQNTAKEKERERKARTKRLIEVGAILEKHLQIRFDEGKRQALSDWLSSEETITSNEKKYSLVDWLKRKIESYQAT